MNERMYVEALTRRFSILPASAQAILNSGFHVEVMMNDALLYGDGASRAMVRDDVFILSQVTKEGPTHTRHPREINVTNQVITLVREMEASKCKN